MTRLAWTIVLCSATILGINMGIRQGFGLFLTPMSQDLGFTRETFAFAMGVSNLIWGAAAPFFGALADRLGVKIAVLIAVVLYAAGLMTMAWQESGSGLLMGGILVGFGISGTGFSVFMGAVGRAVAPEKRSAALAMTTMGGSIGQFVALPYIHLLIDHFGWINCLLFLAATILLALPLALGAAAGDKHYLNAEKSEQSMVEAFREASKHKGFWLLTLGFFVCGFHLLFIAVHMPAYLTDNGLEPWVGVASLTIIGVSNVIGTYVLGKLGDPFGNKNVLSMIYLARAACFSTFLLLPVTMYTAFGFSVAIGFLWLGTVPLTSGVIANIFGPRYLSMLFGIVFFSHQVGGFLGVWLGGIFYDVMGSYDSMWGISVILGIGSAALHWPIREAPVERTATIQQTT